MYLEKSNRMERAKTKVDQGKKKGGKDEYSLGPSEPSVPPLVSENAEVV